MVHVLTVHWPHSWNIFDFYSQFTSFCWENIPHESGRSEVDQGEMEWLCVCNMEMVALLHRNRKAFHFRSMCLQISILNLNNNNNWPRLHHNSSNLRVNCVCMRWVPAGELIHIFSENNNYNRNPPLLFVLNILLSYLYTIVLQMCQVNVYYSGAYFNKHDEHYMNVCRIYILCIVVTQLSNTLHTLCNHSALQ